MNTKPIRVALYMRVSTDEQTTDNQRHDLLKVVDLRGWTIADEYIDQGISGSKGREERPAFARLCSDAQDGKFDMVAAWAIDRLGRSVSHLVQFMDELRQKEVGLYLHQQQIDTSTAAGRAMLQMCGVFAELERSLISERIRTALALRKAQGVKLGSPAPTRGGSVVAELWKHYERVKDMRVDFCVFCGTKEGIEHHHVVPVAEGGSNEPENILTVCGRHHGMLHKIRRAPDLGTLITAGLERAKARGSRLGSPNPRAGGEANRARIARLKGLV